FLSNENVDNDMDCSSIIFMMDVEVVKSWLLYEAEQIEFNTPRKKVTQLLDFKFQLSHYLLPAEKPKVLSNDECVPLQVRRPAVVPLPSPAVRCLDASHMPELVDQKSASRCRNPDCSQSTKFRCGTCQ
ncbi:hypothetical protein HPB47_017552, partial [Ixodes persulcatus]